MNIIAVCSVYFGFMLTAPSGVAPSDVARALSLNAYVATTPVEERRQNTRDIAAIFANMRADLRTVKPFIAAARPVCEDLTAGAVEANSD